MKNLIKFSSQMDSTLLALCKEIAEQQGRKLQDIFNEALKDYVEKIQTGKARPHVMKTFRKSLQRHDSLYSKLAK